MEVKHNDFIRLFERYGWTVEQLDDNSYIASNDTFFVPFSLCYYTNYAAAVSYLVEDKEAFIQEWKRKNERNRFGEDIGYYAFSNFMNHCDKFTHCGNIGNHDHSTWEIESWLKRLNER